MSESKSILEKKKEELESLELDAQIINVEEKIKRRQSGELATETPNLAEKLVEQVVLPIVKKNLEPDKDSSVARDALKLAHRAQDRADRAGRGEPRKSETVSDIVNALASFKDLIKDDSLKAQLDEVTKQVKAIGERPEKEGDLDMIDKVLGIVDKIQERVKPAGGGTTDGYFNFEKWKIEQERKTTMQDRAFQLRIRQQDKEQDIKLAALGIERDRNELLQDGLKKIGTAIGEALGEEDDYEEDEESAKGRQQLIKEKCTECEAEILIPPEAQVAGNEIKCSNCNSIFTWE